MASLSPENCWEFWKCKKHVRDKCQAYLTASGRECWMILGPPDGKDRPKNKKRFSTCVECPWFRKLNPAPG